jgi:hypothetical protein
MSPKTDSPSPSKKLQDFLDKEQFEVTVSLPLFSINEQGGLSLLEPQQIIVTRKEEDARTN